jgi:flagellar hook-associated protein 2
MAGVSLGGMSSGLDTQSIIDQLMAIERQPEARLKLRESALQARQTALTDVASRLRNLLAQAKSLGSVATWVDTQTLDVSDPAKVSATRLSGAAPGGHTIEVTTLARAEQRSFSFQAGAGTLDIGGTPIMLTADDDGQDAADKINAATGSPFYAVWVKDPLGGTDDRLVLTRKQTGLTGVPAVSVSGANLTPVGTTQPGVDAEYTVDGNPQKSNTNVVKSAIPGLQLTLKATGTTSVTVSAPGPDNDAV